MTKVFLDSDVILDLLIDRQPYEAEKVTIRFLKKIIRCLFSLSLVSGSYANCFRLCGSCHHGVEGYL